MKRFQWYRRLRGGKWYYNRYIFNTGTSVIFCWERVDKESGWSGHTLKMEDYTDDNIVFEK